MLNLLHDRVDETEALRERARETVERIVKAKIADAYEASGRDFEKTLLILAGLVGDELASLTTDSVQRGIEYAKKRAVKRDQAKVPA
jgi:hypothetical protein